MSNDLLTRVRYAPYPWSPSMSDSVPCVRGRPCIVTQDDVEEVLVDVCDASLPSIGVWTDDQGHRWRKFELPAARSDIESLASTEAMQVTMLPERGGGWTECVRVPGAMLPIRTLQDEEETLASRSTDPIVCGSYEAESLIENYLDFINGLYEHTRSHALCWEGNATGFAVRSVARALTRWRKLGSKSEPRMALIVKLARELPDILSDVCHHPRQVLRRVRRRLNVARIQELDSACLRWLARQPGRSIVEKAGPKQQLLGVVRIEDTDTPENRVVKDLLRRAQRECRRYLVEHRSFGNHKRVESVRRFMYLLDSLLRSSAIAGVRPLVGVASPNYVLQYDPRYRRLWEAYVLLVRQEKQQDSTWRWRQRTWAEQCGLTLLSSIRALTAGGPALRSDMLFQYEHVTGCFLGPATQVGQWLGDTHGSPFHVDFLFGSQLELYPRLPRWLTCLSPDYVLVARHDRNASREPHVLGVWTMFDFAHSPHDLQQQADSLNNAVERHSTSGSFRALLIEPSFENGGAGTDDRVSGSSTDGIRLPVKPRGEEEELLAIVRRGLGMS